MEQFQEIKDGLAQLKQLKQDIVEIRALKKEIQALLREYHDVEAQNAKLTCQLKELEVYQSLNVEIRRLPFDAEPVMVVNKIVNVAAEEIDENDIDIYHKAPASRHNETNIIVLFVQDTITNTF